MSEIWGRAMSKGGLGALGMTNDLLRAGGGSHPVLSSLGIRRGQLGARAPGWDDVAARSFDPVCDHVQADAGAPGAWLGAHRARQLKLGGAAA